MVKFQFKRMPFGLKGAPSTFQRLMDRILEPCREFSKAYSDDIIIFSVTWEEHLHHLKDVLQILDKIGIPKRRSATLAWRSASIWGTGLEEARSS